MKIKKIHSLLIPALILFTFIGCNGNEVSDSPYIIGAEKYYLSGEHEKIFLYEIIGLSVVQLDTTQNFEISLEKLKENPKFTSINTLREDDCLVLLTSKLSIQEIKQQPTVINAMPAYNSGKSIDFLNPVYLTGELILQLKEGYSVDDICYLFENNAVIKKMDKYNKCILQVVNWEKIFDLANTLHLHEKVLYCEPNKFSNYKLF